ncbi:MAG: preprotein translocase subunit YajC [Actinomycetota bacterium]|nr:preprotein translocase subunit YajC [Actinomycetota bacterium]
MDAATTIAMVAQARQPQNFTFLISLVLMVAIFYFLLIRPQQRRVRQQRELIQSLEVGDEVVTIGGLYGRITRMDEDSVTIDADGTLLRFVRQAIARKLVVEEEPGQLGMTEGP